MLFVKSLLFVSYEYGNIPTLSGLKKTDFQQLNEWKIHVSLTSTFRCM